MVDLIEEAFRLQTFLQDQQCQFCFIGGIAVQHWGEPRLTRDIDISLFTGFGNEARFVDLLLGVYRPRIEDARRFSLTYRTLLLSSEEGIGIDVSLAALSYEEEVIRRAVPVELLPQRSLRLCSPEDLVIMKLFASRETDLRDARSVLVRQAGSLDSNYIETQLAAFEGLKEGPSLTDQFRRLRASIH